MSAEGRALILDLFSKRRKIERGELPDTFQYTVLPEPLRVQIVQILREAVQDESDNRASQRAFTGMRDILRREYGTFRLWKDKNAYSDPEPEEEVLNFLLAEKDVEKALDAVELGALVLTVRDAQGGYSRPARSATDAIEEINQRFREHGVGFQIEDGKVVRCDSQLVHQEVVRPALALLRGRLFAGANSEFLRAHEHYRHDRREECLVDCLKSFESVMKAICDERGWAYSQKDAAAKLLSVCFDNELIPKEHQAQLTALKSVLEAGVPTIRNANAGHGQGTKPRRVSKALVRFCLNQTATVLLFLAESDEDLG